MKFIIFLVCLFSSSYFFAAESEESDKIYLNPGQIVVSENNIYLELDNQWVPVKAVLVDKRGVYTKPCFLAWDCSSCGWPNNSRALVCANCGHPRF